MVAGEDEEPEPDGMPEEAGAFEEKTAGRGKKGKKGKRGEAAAANNEGGGGDGDGEMAGIEGGQAVELIPCRCVGCINVKVFEPRDPNTSATHGADAESETPATVNLEKTEIKKKTRDNEAFEN